MLKIDLITLSVNYKSCIFWARNRVDIWDYGKLCDITIISIEEIEESFKLATFFDAPLKI